MTFFTSLVSTLELIVPNSLCLLNLCMSLVRPHIEYASYSCMDPYHVTDITRCKHLPYECVANSGIQATLSF